jgi:hypothetical protein
VTKKWVVPVFIVLAVLGVVFLAVGLVYLTVHANKLPSFFPGHVATRYGKKHHNALPTHAHTKRGFVAIILAIASFVGAYWVLFQYKPADEKV